MSSSKKDFFSNLLLILIGLAVGMAVLLALDFGIGAYRAFNGTQNYYVRPPHLHAIFLPSSQIFPGVGKRARFTIDSLGFRGDELPKDAKYRILAIGGSTTECAYIDQPKTWVELLGKRLNELGKARVWVANAGVSARTSRNHVLHLKYLLTPKLNFNLIINLEGVTDLMGNLNRGDYRKPFSENAVMAQAFDVSPVNLKDPKTEFLFIVRNMGSVRFIRALFDRIRHKEFIEDTSGRFYWNWRYRRRHSGKFVDHLPDLKEPLNDYRRNINAMIDIADERHVRILFLTQPYLWKPEMTKAESDLLWYGWVFDPKTGRYNFYTVPALIEGMDAYNRVLLDVCRKRGVECIDLEKMIPKTTEYFYDDVHFTEKGCLRISQILFQYLRQGPPFNL